MASYILGISAFYHDSSAALLKDGEVLAAAQEERFSRIKHDSSFPKSSIEFVLDYAGISLDQVEMVAFYEKPFLKFERLLETYHALAPKGVKSFLAAMPVWMKEKLLMKRMLKKELSQFGEKVPKLIFPEHHLSHAASAFYPSPYPEAAILTIDAVGEWATTTISRGSGNSIEVLKQLDFPHSVGLLYSAFTYYCGFKVNSGEYKLMGLAPYGNKNSKRTKEFIEAIHSELISVKDDGSLFLNLDFFEFATNTRMCNEAKWERLFKLKRRVPETELSQDYMDLALACQIVTEDIVLKMVQTARKVTNCKNLVLAGGVALNCVANGKLVEANIFENIWIQPAAGDAGGSLGAALSGWYISLGKHRTPGPQDSMQGSYLGPEFSRLDIERVIRKYSAGVSSLNNREEFLKIVAQYLVEDKVVGWFQGRMEFGPRALGNRSIIANPCSESMQKKINLKIKFREGFRPFAPAVLEEDLGNYFETTSKSPYMLLVAPVKGEICTERPENWNDLSLKERLYFRRSSLPAITHIDNSARVQSVSKETNPVFWELLQEFKENSGHGVLVNTSFNVRGEPIVCGPEDAYRCFMSTDMDVLVLNNFVFLKEEQPKFQREVASSSSYNLD